MAKVSLRTWAGRYRSAHFWLVTGLGTGMMRPAPGTWGSLLGLAQGYLMHLAGFEVPALLAMTAALTAVSSWSIDRIEAETGIHDAPEIIIDEIVGQWLALVPVIILAPSLVLYGIAFLLFRLFDVIKPWPIGWLDKKVSGGFGVIVDDLAAGILAAISIWLLLTTGLLDGFI
jgi:phosphatidylglycerophosphatase A